MTTFRLPRVMIIVILACLLAACSGPTQPTATPDPLQGGVLATFEAAGETFRVWVTNPNTIEQLLALQAGASTASIPNGRIHAGPGAGDHNAPWSWHLDPDDIDMADMTMELCDGAPNYVEDNLSEFTDVIQRYCPWGAELTALDDRR